MNSRHESWDDYHAEKLRDPEYARVYLVTALEDYHVDHDRSSLLNALRNVAEAQGGIEKVAERANLDFQSLNAVLMDKSNPLLDAIDAIAGGLGYRLSLQAVAQGS